MRVAQPKKQHHDKEAPQPTTTNEKPNEEGAKTEEAAPQEA